MPAAGLSDAGRPPRPWPRTFAGRVFLVQAVIVVAGMLLVGVISAHEIEHANEHRLAEQAQVVAEALSRQPEMLAAVEGDAPTPEAQASLESIFAGSGLDFAVVVDADGRRLAHSDDSKVGELYTGSREEALDGRTVVLTETGSRGRSTRVVAPIRAADGSVVGAAVAGVTTDAVTRRSLASMGVALAAAAGSVIVALVASGFVARWARRVTRGAPAEEVAASVGFYSSVLDAAADAVLLLDERGRVVQVNEPARRLLGLREDPEELRGECTSELGLPDHALSLLRQPGPVDDAVLLLGERVVLLTLRDVEREGRPVGRVVRMSDHTRARDLINRLDGAQGTVEILREQTHEFRNRLHAIVWQLETGHAEEALAFASEELEATRALTPEESDDGRTAVSALLLAKRAAAADRGIDFVADRLGVEDLGLTAREAVSVMGNLLDNAFEAVAARGDAVEPRVMLAVRRETEHVTVEVADDGVGLAGSAGEAVSAGWTTKEGEGRGVGLAVVRQIAESRGGHVLITAGEAGVGTVVRVRLPRAVPVEVRGSGPVRAPEGRVPGGEPPEGPSGGRGGAGP